MTQHKSFSYQTSGTEQVTVWVSLTIKLLEFLIACLSILKSKVQAITQLLLFLRKLK